MFLLLHHQSLPLSLFQLLLSSPLLMILTLLSIIIIASLDEERISSTGIFVCAQQSTTSTTLSSTTASTTSSSSLPPAPRHHLKCGPPGTNPLIQDFSAVVTLPLTTDPGYDPNEFCDVFFAEGSQFMRFEYNEHRAPIRTFVMKNVELKVDCTGSFGTGGDEDGWPAVTTLDLRDYLIDPRTTNDDSKRASILIDGVTITTTNFLITSAANKRLMSALTFDQRTIKEHFETGKGYLSTLIVRNSKFVSTTKYLGDDTQSRAIANPMYSLTIGNCVATTEETSFQAVQEKMVIEHNDFSSTDVHLTICMRINKEKRDEQFPSEVVIPKMADYSFNSNGELHRHGGPSEAMINKNPLLISSSDTKTEQEKLSRLSSISNFYDPSAHQQQQLLLIQHNKFSVIQPLSQCNRQNDHVNHRGSFACYRQYQFIIQWSWISNIVVKNNYFYSKRPAGVVTEVFFMWHAFYVKNFVFTHNTVEADAELLPPPFDRESQGVSVEFYAVRFKASNFTRLALIENNKITVRRAMYAVGVWFGACRVNASIIRNNEIDIGATHVDARYGVGIGFAEFLDSPTSSSNSSAMAHLDVRDSSDRESERDFSKAVIFMVFVNNSIKVEVRRELPVFFDSLDPMRSVMIFYASAIVISATYFRRAIVYDNAVDVSAHIPELSTMTLFGVSFVSSLPATLTELVLIDKNNITLRGGGHLVQGSAFVNRNAPSGKMNFTTRHNLINLGDVQVYHSRIFETLPIFFRVLLPAELTQSFLTCATLRANARRVDITNNKCLQQSQPSGLPQNFAYVYAYESVNQIRFILLESNEYRVTLNQKLKENKKDSDNEDEILWRNYSSPQCTFAAVGPFSEIAVVDTAAGSGDREQQQQKIEQIIIQHNNASMMGGDVLFGALPNAPVRNIIIRHNSITARAVHPQYSQSLWVGPYTVRPAFGGSPSLNIQFRPYDYNLQFPTASFGLLTSNSSESSLNVVDGVVTVEDNDVLFSLMKDKTKQPNENNGDDSSGGSRRNGFQQIFGVLCLSTESFQTWHEKKEDIQVKDIRYDNFRCFSGDVSIRRVSFRTQDEEDEEIPSFEQKQTQIHHQPESSFASSTFFLFSQHSRVLQKGQHHYYPSSLSSTLNIYIDHNTVQLGKLVDTLFHKVGVVSLAYSASASSSNNNHNNNNIYIRSNQFDIPRVGSFFAAFELQPVYDIVNQTMATDNDNNNENNDNNDFNLFVHSSQNIFVVGVEKDTKTENTFYASFFRTADAKHHHHLASSSSSSSSSPSNTNNNSRTIKLEALGNFLDIRNSTAIMLHKTTSESTNNNNNADENSDLSKIIQVPKLTQISSLTTEEAKTTTTIAPRMTIDISKKPICNKVAFSSSPSSPSSSLIYLLSKSFFFPHMTKTNDDDENENSNQHKTPSTSMTMTIPTTFITSPECERTFRPTATPTFDVNATIDPNPGAVDVLTRTTAQVVADVTQSSSMVMFSAASPVMPSLAFGVSRQQSTLNFMNAARDGDCSGLVGAVDREGNVLPPGLADSPTQLAIGSSSAKYLVGGVIGNTLVTFGLCLFMQLLGHWYMRVTGSTSWKKPFAVFARCHISLVFFVLTSMLLAPTLQFALVAVAVKEKKGIDTADAVSLVPPATEFRILAIIVGVMIFAVPTIFYAIWTLFLRTNQVEKYRPIHHFDEDDNSSNNNNSDDRSCIINLLGGASTLCTKIINYFFTGPGEWQLPRRGVSEKQRLDFDVSLPMLDGYQARAKWFGLVEYVLQVALATAPFFAQVVPTEVSCIVEGTILCVSLSTFVILCVYFRPFQEKFCIVVLPLAAALNVVIVVLVLVYAGNLPGFVEDVAVASVSLQSVVAVVTLLFSLGPLVKPILRVVRRLRRAMRSRNSNNSNNHNRLNDQSRKFDHNLNHHRGEEGRTSSKRGKKEPEATLRDLLDGWGDDDDDDNADVMLRTSRSKSSKSHNNTDENNRGHKSNKSLSEDKHDRRNHQHHSSRASRRHNNFLSRIDDDDDDSRRRKLPKQSSLPNVSPSLHSQRSTNHHSHHHQRYHQRTKNSPSSSTLSPSLTTSTMHLLPPSASAEASPSSQRASSSTMVINDEKSRRRGNNTSHGHSNQRHSNSATPSRSRNSKSDKRETSSSKQNTTVFTRPRRNSDVYLADI